MSHGPPARAWRLSLACAARQRTCFSAIASSGHCVPIVTGIVTRGVVSQTTGSSGSRFPGSTFSGSSSRAGPRNFSSSTILGPRPPSPRPARRQAPEPVRDHAPFGPDSGHDRGFRRTRAAFPVERGAVGPADPPGQARRRHRQPTEASLRSFRWRPARDRARSNARSDPVAKRLGSVRNSRSPWCQEWLQRSDLRITT